jgi:hypothetical protein
VDLDYKGLANTGTWFLGRLQTERDKMRVLEGLEGASAATGGSFDRAQFERILAGLKSRVFLMNNVHEDAPILFQTRWTLSYLRGPLTRSQIQQLASDAAPAEEPARAGAGAGRGLGPSWGTGAAGTSGTAATSGAAPSAAEGPTGAAMPSASRAQPSMPAGAEVAFLAVARSVPGSRLVYQPALLGQADLHFSKGAAVDVWETRSYLAPLGPDAGARAWEGATPLDGTLQLRDQPEAGAGFADLPPAARNSGSYRTWEKSFASFLYQTATLNLYSVPELRLTGRPGETEADLRIRARELAHERRDRAVEQLRRRYAPKVRQLEARLRRAQDRIGREQSQVQSQGLQTAISVGATVLGALLGRRSGPIGHMGRATTAARGAGRVAREQEDVARAREEAAHVQQQLAELEVEVEREAMRVAGSVDPEAATITEQVIRPRKADTSIRRVSLLWVPVAVNPTGAVTAAWQA